MTRPTDDLDEFIADRTRRNPAFPQLVDAALARRRQRDGTRSYDEAMSITVDLPDAALHRLEGEAARRGVSIAALIADLALNLPAAGEGFLRDPSVVGVGASGQGTTDRIDELLAGDFGRH